jgi:hypothetical protein
MDLRPRLAQEFAEAIFADWDQSDQCVDVLTPAQREALISRWTEIILSRFKSHSIQFPKGDYGGTKDPAVVEAFLVKYPDLRERVDKIKEWALGKWPNITFKLEVMSDPDTCHICSEGQLLALRAEGKDILDDPDSTTPDLSLWFDSISDTMLNEWCQNGHHSLLVIM